MKTVKIPTATPEQTDHLRSVVHVPGAVEILCKEIGFRYQSGMETPAMLRAFVCVLVDDINQMLCLGQFMARHGAAAPSAEAEDTFTRVRAMLEHTDPAELVLTAANVHDVIYIVNPDEKYPTDHLIDMLSGCVSAVRFGLEMPCHSRHAAAAAKHIWKKMYGVALHDRLSNEWSNDYARSVLERALLLQISTQ